MKKGFALALAIICMLALLAGCSAEKSFNITGASKIELQSGNGARVEITDSESIKHITDNINAIKFSKGKVSNNYTGWGYRLRWYNADNKLMEEIVINSANKIDYKNHFYHSMKADDDMDIAYLDMLLSGSDNNS